MRPLIKLVPTIEKTELLSKPFMKLVPAAPVAQAQNGISCTICTLIVGFAEDKLGSNATLAEIETFLNTTVCNLLPSFLRPECAALVDQYAPQIAQKIFQGFPASVVCKDIGLCSSPVKAALVAAKAQDGIGCTICTLIVGFAEDKLESNATLAQIETFLNTTVCHLLPSFLRGECAALMDEYAPQIAQKIAQGYPASVVCKDVGLCSAAPKPLLKLVPTIEQMALLRRPLMKLVPTIDKMEVLSHPLMKLVPTAAKLFMKLLPAAPVIKGDNGIVCSICTLIVGYAEDKLESNATVAEIETFLNTTVCGLLPSFLRPECQTLVDEYAPQIAANIEKGYPASVVCKDVGLCVSASKQKLVAAAKTQNGIVCTICTLIVGYTEDRLGSNSSIADIEEFLNTTVCNLLPSVIRPECASLVDEYAPQIAEKIFQGYPASVVCKDIGLCVSAKPTIVRPLLKLVAPVAQMAVLTAPLKKLVPAARPAGSPNSIECLVCRLVVNAAEEELSNASTVQEVESFLNSTACIVLPRLFRPECAVLVDTYLPNLVAHIIARDNATVVCTDVHAC
jgi:saposin